MIQLENEIIDGDADKYKDENEENEEEEENDQDTFHHIPCTVVEGYRG